MTVPQISKIPEKLSRKEAIRENNLLRERIVGLSKARRHDFNLIFTLGIHLYKLQPDHVIFSDGSMNEEFVASIKKVAEGQIRKQGGVVPDKITEGGERPAAAVGENTTPSENIDSLAK